MCFVGHKVFKRKLKQLLMFLPFAKSLFAHSFGKGDWGLAVHGCEGGPPCSLRVEVLKGGHYC